MGYADPDSQRIYQREWMAERRAALLEGKSCELCGSQDFLIILGSNRRGFWSRSPERQQMIMKSTRILCRDCRRTRPTAICANPACGKGFHNTKSQSKYCSRECYRQDASRVNLNRTFKEKECPTSSP
jgi:hypothetical protein